MPPLYFDEFPELYRILVTDRNRRWMPQIEQLLKDKQDYLVVVGALHLVGKEGLIELAQGRGLKPRRGLSSVSVVGGNTLP